MTQQPQYDEIETLHEGHLQATLTRRARPHGPDLISFCFFREMIDGRRTPWLNLRFIKSLRKILDKLEKRLGEEEAKANSSKPAQVGSGS